MIDENEIVWYPLRVTYAREMKVKEYLAGRGIESFIRMRYEQKLRGEEMVKIQVPVVHNFIFVHISKAELKDIKAASLISPFIRYIMNLETRLPLIVPDKQMQDFIAVAGSMDEQLMYLSSAEVAMKKGDRVRIIGGIWEGVEGKFVRIKRGLRVVVEIEGIMAVATASLHPSLVEKIEG